MNTIRSRNLSQHYMQNCKSCRFTHRTYTIITTFISAFKIPSLLVAVFSDIWMIVKAMEVMDTGMEEVSQILMQLSQAQGDEEAVQILEGIAPILSTPQVCKSNISSM